MHPCTGCVFELMHARRRQLEKQLRRAAKLHRPRPCPISSFRLLRTNEGGVSVSKLLEAKRSHRAVGWGALLEGDELLLEPRRSRQGRPRAAVDDSAVGEPRRKAFISKETGRRVRTTLTLQQTRVLQDKFEEQKHWNPKQCAAMLPNLNQLGPDLAVEQVIRWFDNRRRTLKARGGSAPAASGRAGDALEDEGVEPSAKKSGAVKDEKKTRRVSQVEREILEAAFSKNAAPDIRVRHALATATGLSQEQVTAWFMRRQATKRAPYGVIPGAKGMPR